jgi:hypothetical protein
MYGTEDVQDLRIVLAAGVSIDVSVRDNSGVAYSKGVNVYLCRKQDLNAITQFKPKRMPGIQPNESGDCRFEHVGSGEYKLFADLGDGRIIARDVKVEDAPLSVNLDVDGGLGGRIEGRVIGADGKPLAGAKIATGNPSGQGRPKEGKTDDDGRYVFTNLEAGPYVVFLQDHDTTVDEAFLVRRRVEVANGKTARMDIDYSAKPVGNVFSGRLLVDGAAKLTACDLYGTGTSTSFIRGKVQADGRFELGGIPPGNYYAWFYDDRGNLTFRAAVRFPDWQGRETFDRNLVSTSLDITVVGLPENSSASVQVLPKLDDLFGPEARDVSPRHFSTVNGRAVVTGIFEGTCWVRVSAPGKAIACAKIDTAREKAVTLNLSADCGGADITLADLPAIYASDKELRGHLFCYAADGAPVAERKSRWSCAGWPRAAIALCWALGNL